MGDNAKASNNQNTTDATHGKIEYKYDTRDATQNTSGGPNPGKYSAPSDAIPVPAEVDLFKRWGAVGIYFSEQVKSELGKSPINNWTTTITDAPIKEPLIISSATASLAFAGIFIGLIMSCSIESSIIYVLIGILFSIFAITSALVCILKANSEDKVNLKGINFTEQHLEYTQIQGYNTGSAFNNLEAEQSGTTVDATSLTGNKVYFQVTKDSSNKPNPPTVQVKGNPTTNAVGIAKDNIHCTFGY